MRKALLPIVFMLLVAFGSVNAQDNALTFDHIAPIIHQNCTPCHRPGASGPFDLITYTEVASRAEFIQYVTQIRYMPPWKADPDYRSFHNQRRLSGEEINQIRDWVKAGAPAGEKEFVKEDLLKAYDSVNTPDLILRMNDVFTIPGNNTEQFRVFVIPTRLTEDKWVKEVRFVPGNKKLAHHARVMVDTTNLLRPDDGIEVGAASMMEQKKVRLWDYFWHGWVPGNQGNRFPDGLAKKLPANSDLILNMHYSPTSVEAEDQSEIHLYFTDEPVDREVKTFIMDEKLIKNQPFSLPADTVITFYMRSPVVQNDISMLSMLPHMHVLGRKFKAFAITSAGKNIPLIKIRDWDFNWQMGYQPEALIHIPAGSTIYVQATYDNTDLNLANPHSPPRKVDYGWGTYNEMMNFIFQYVDYKENDERLTIN